MYETYYAHSSGLVDAFCYMNFVWSVVDLPLFLCHCTYFLSVHKRCQSPFNSFVDLLSGVKYHTRIVFIPMVLVK